MVDNGMDFKYGTLIIKCHQCGGEEILDELVTDGRAIYLFNREDSYLKLPCHSCGITMELSIKPSPVQDDEPEILEETINELEKNEELPEEITPEEVI